MTITKMKTPISYYGGKQSMVNDILPLIPDHKIYVEPFFGGGAIFWAKEPSRTEIINDVNMNIVNFYEVLKHQYLDLRKKIEATLHSRETYKRAMVVYDCPWLFPDNPVIRAWAFYVVTNQGFGAKIGTWGYDLNRKAHSVQNKIDSFGEHLSERLKCVQMEQNSAHKVIQSRDSIDTFVYADPPYVDSNQGHYGGYAEEHFRRDLDALASMKGKFLLSSYPSGVLNEYITKHGWHTITKQKLLAAGNGRILKERRMKTEVLTANYELS
jgi:DNA adenine methylase